MKMSLIFNIFSVIIRQPEEINFETSRIQFRQGNLSICSRKYDFFVVEAFVWVPYGANHNSDLGLSPSSC